MAEEWSYRQLADAYREEKGSNALGKLAADYDQSLLLLIRSLESKSSSSSAGVSSADAMRELENARRMSLSLLRLRRHKIIMRALMTGEHGDAGAMSRREHTLYDQVRTLCSREDEELQKHVFTPMEKPLENAKDAAALLRRVHLLKDVPAYRSSDGATYGPYSSGQQVELPEGEASWMLKGGLASEQAARMDEIGASI